MISVRVRLALSIAASTAWAGVPPALSAQEPTPTQETLPVTPPRNLAEQSRQPCVDCHLTLEEERLSEPARLFETDVHAEQGFGCLACHGRLGPEGRMDSASGFLAGMERREIPGLCGSCHSDAAFMRDYNPSLRVDQVTEYVTSIHGQRLIELEDPDVATCADCHQSHQIRSSDDPESSVHPLNVAATCGSCHTDPDLMEEHGLEADQVDEHRAGIHGQLLYEGGDISAPTCNDCHGNHGAAPPGVASVQNVCGECHAMMADFFERSEHAVPFGDEDLPGCVTCHGNHEVLEPTDQLLTTASRDVCAQCHEAGDESAGEFGTILVLLDSLIVSADEARAALAAAENLGIEVSQAEFELEEVNNQLTMARTAIHSFHADAVREEVAKGRATTATALTRAEEAFQEHRFRRVGLGGSAGLIAIVIFGLIYRIRRIDVQLERAADATEAFFGEHMAGVGEKGLRLAASSLLLEEAHADSSLREGERSHIQHLILDQFGVEEGEARELFTLAHQQRRRAMDAGQFTRLIAARFNDEQKTGLVEILWGVALPDQILARREYVLIERISTLIGLSKEQIVDARFRVVKAEKKRQKKARKKARKETDN